MRTFHRQLRRFRKELDWAPKEIAQAIQVAEKTYRRIENGTSPIDSQRLDLILSAFAFQPRMYRALQEAWHNDQASYSRTQGAPLEILGGPDRIADALEEAHVEIASLFNGGAVTEAISLLKPVLHSATEHAPPSPELLRLAFLDGVMQSSVGNYGEALRTIRASRKTAAQLGDPKWLAYQMMYEQGYENRLVQRRGLAAVGHLMSIRDYIKVQAGSDDPLLDTTWSTLWTHIHRTQLVALSDSLLSMNRRREVLLSIFPWFLARCVPEGDAEAVWLNGIVASRVEALLDMPDRALLRLETLPRRSERFRDWAFVAGTRAIALFKQGSLEQSLYELESITARSALTDTTSGIALSRLQSEIRKESTKSKRTFS